MTLGFSVPELLGAGRMGRAMTMGLRRLPEADWLWPDFDRAARAAVFDAHPEAVQLLPGAEAAAREVAAMIGISGGLEAAARACWEDLCIMQRAEPGAPWRLTGAAVGFPTDWRLADKIGRPMAEIHAPIHGYADQLARGVDHFMEALEPDQIFARANWFIVPSMGWRYLPEGDEAVAFAHVTADNAGETLVVRCERQTLRRLPQTGAILFTIGIARARLREVPPGLALRLSQALAAMPADEQARRLVGRYAEPLMRHAHAASGESGFSSAAG
ncbi:MAG: DUF3445 domain-containing protein [Alphaproteobacteria bacterium]|nr:DUF3445 domain-containing protein [Alphaproteobacteria bacterium]MBU0795528.1 DUF3445 domain-containing protein [Alphaproteobacteria bacterium]MBU0874669.1 DUF3445 domain-containing protein [Alphaproteobacteria bacterium]MBU1770077.1 DUF3445 domain-containing protein [Alphaproteobacteria bacterium]